ncbi:hypothetical protein GQ43DRAFT_470165 [Delitschia confertaspora ATCC 74209]|uniref:Uncharacterized protein n=1 Tax=Delitschia confertaspora ATCC 74209 TaxID=1513339 RepID=A0A9P4MXH6_9PLEO|nr:hypothetical protein GQ43DRAFT_470165 [Delitschia confertaspora ATCC 74209]
MTEASLKTCADEKIFLWAHNNETDYLTAHSRLLISSSTYCADIYNVFANPNIITVHCADIVWLKIYTYWLLVDCWIVENQLQDEKYKDAVGTKCDYMLNSKRSTKNKTDKIWNLIVSGVVKYKASEDIRKFGPRPRHDHYTGSLWGILGIA